MGGPGISHLRCLSDGDEWIQFKKVTGAAERQEKLSDKKIHSHPTEGCLSTMSKYKKNANNKLQMIVHPSHKIS